MRLLLDTCTFLWLISGSSKLSKPAEDAILDPDNGVFLSVVSAWEIGVKNALGRLPLPAPPEQFVPEMRKGHLLATLPLDEESTLQLGRLPDLHKDPFDRMLVCQALQHNLILVTPDESIRQYSVHSLW